MSLINHSHKFVFVHIPKAAGTSVTNLLSKYTEYRDLEIGGTQFGESIQQAYFDRFGLYKHAPASRIRQVMGKEDWDAYFTFSFVRSPYARVVSVYNFLRQWEGCPTKIKEIMLSFNNVNEFVLSDVLEQTNGPDEIFRAQAYWLTDPDDREEILIHNFYKVEEIDRGLSDILGRLEQKRDKVTIPKLNTSTSKIDVKLNNLSIKKIEKKYARDFDLFGYERVSNEN
tara:strand:+ start:559 stop:1239 length:681 start_codon:yes stop_codon:yes gene_type:complete